MRTEFDRRMEVGENIPEASLCQRRVPALCGSDKRVGVMGFFSALETHVLVNFSTLAVFHSVGWSSVMPSFQHLQSPAPVTCLTVVMLYHCFSAPAT